MKFLISCGPRKFKISCGADEHALVRSKRKNVNFLKKSKFLLFLFCFRDQKQNSLQFLYKHHKNFVGIKVFYEFLSKFCKNFKDHSNKTCLNAFTWKFYKNFYVKEKNHWRWFFCPSRVFHHLHPKCKWSKGPRKAHFGPP